MSWVEIFSYSGNAIKTPRRRMTDIEPLQSASGERGAIRGGGRLEVLRRSGVIAGTVRDHSQSCARCAVGRCPFETGGETGLRLLGGAKTEPGLSEIVQDRRIVGEFLGEISENRDAARAVARIREQSAERIEELGIAGGALRRLGSEEQR